MIELILYYVALCDKYTTDLTTHDRTEITKVDTREHKSNKRFQKDKLYFGAKN